jgi:hypothetical protein
MTKYALNFSSKDVEPCIIEDFPDEYSHGFDVAGILIGPGRIKKQKNPNCTYSSAVDGADVRV